MSGHHESAIGGKGMGMKVSDKCCVPLCYVCHATVHRIGSRSFWGPDYPRLAKIAKKWWKQYQRQKTLWGNKKEKKENDNEL